MVVHYNFLKVWKLSQVWVWRRRLLPSWGEKSQQPPYCPYNLNTVVTVDTTWILSILSIQPDYRWCCRYNLNTFDTVDTITSLLYISSIQPPYRRYNLDAVHIVDTTSISSIQPPYRRYSLHTVDTTSMLSIQPEYCRYNLNTVDTSWILSIQPRYCGTWRSGNGLGKQKETLVMYTSDPCKLERTYISPPDSPSTAARKQTKHKRK